MVSTLITSTGIAIQIAREAYVQWCLHQVDTNLWKRAVNLDPKACSGYFMLGLFYSFDLSGANQTRAGELLREAVRCQPLQAKYWVALASQLQSNGHADEAIGATETAAALGAHNAIIQWNTGNLFLVAGKTDRALDMFRRVLMGAPEFSRQVFTLCWKSSASGEAILRRAVPNTVKMNLAYLNFLSSPENLDPNELLKIWSRLPGLDDQPPPGDTFTSLDGFIRSWRPPTTLEDRANTERMTSEEKSEAIKKKSREAERLIDEWDQAVNAVWQPRLEQAQRVWSRLMNSSEPFPLEQCFPYINALIQASRVDEGLRAWNQLVAKGMLPPEDWRVGDNLIVNGGFELQPVNGGFDWRILPVPGVDVETDVQTHHQGQSSLAIHFEGLSNLNFYHVMQYVPVEHSTVYHFSAFIKSRALSTQSGLHIEIYDPHDAADFFWRTPDVLGTTVWTEYNLTLRAGPKTDLLIVRLRREPAVGLEKRIEGTLWVDDVQLTADRPSQ